MTRTAGLLAALTLACLPLDGSAQARPDFSAQWTSEPETGAQATPGGGRRGGGAPGGTGRRGGGPPPSGDMGSGWGSSIAITQDARHLTVEYAFFSRGDLQPPIRFTYALDGSQTRNTVTMGRGIQELVSTAAWRADTLVITTTTTFVHPATGDRVESTETRSLSLDSAGALVVEVTRGGVLGGQPSTTRTTYRRAS